MSGITTHILDTAAGSPARGVAITLELERDGAYSEIGRGHTDDDGRCKTLMGERALEAGTYRISFDTGGYYAGRSADCFFPRVQIEFTVRDAGQHYHVPILLSPFGYTTYRGS